MKNYMSTGCYNPWCIRFLFDYGWMEWDLVMILKSDLHKIPPGDLRTTLE